MKTHLSYREEGLLHSVLARQAAIYAIFNQSFSVNVDDSTTCGMLTCTRLISSLALMLLSLSWYLVRVSSESSGVPRSSISGHAFTIGTLRSKQKLTDLLNESSVCSGSPNMSETSKRMSKSLCITSLTSPFDWDDGLPLLLLWLLFGGQTRVSWGHPGNFTILSRNPSLTISNWHRREILPWLLLWMSVSKTRK